MFGRPKISLTGITNDDIRLLNEMAYIVSEWELDAPASDRVHILRRAYACIAMVKDIKKGKTPRLTVQTVTDLRQLTVYFKLAADEALADLLAEGNADPDKRTAYMTTRKDAANRIHSRLTELLREDAKLR